MEGMQIEDTARSRLLIASGVIDQCNQENLPDEKTFWIRFAELYDKRVGDGSGTDTAVLLKGILNP